MPDPLQTGKTNLNVTDIFDQLMTKTGYACLEAEENDRGRKPAGQLVEFKSVIADYENSAEEPTIDEFMEQLALTAEVNNYHEEDASVTMMTMHSIRVWSSGCVYARHGRRPVPGKPRV